MAILWNLDQLNRLSQLPPGQRPNESILEYQRRQLEGIVPRTITVPGVQQANVGPAAVPAIPAAPVDLTPPAGIARPADEPTQDFGNPPVPLPTITQPQSPLGMGQMSESVTTQKFVDPSALKAMDAAAAEAAAKQRDIGIANASLAEQDAKKAVDLAKIAEDDAKAINERADAAKDLFNGFNANMSQLMQEYQDADIKPKGAFDGSLGQSVAAGFAIALGALGGALNGTNKNRSMEIIERAIDRDLDAQKANLGKKKDAINMLGVQYEAARRAGADDAQARNLAKASTLEQIGQTYAAKAGQANSDIAKARAEILVQDIMMQAAKYRAEATAGQTTTSTKTGGTMGKPMLTPGQEQAEADFGKEYGQWTAGGAAAAKNAIDKLKEIEKVLEENKDAMIGVTGRDVQFLEDYTPVLMSDLSRKIKGDIASTVIPGIKSTFGGNTSNKELEVLIASKLDMGAHPATNLPRVRGFIQELEAQYDAKQAKAKQFKDTGYTQGWQDRLGDKTQTYTPGK